MYKRVTTGVRTKGAFIDEEGITYYPYFPDRINRDENGKVILPDTSSIAITDKVAADIVKQEILRYNKEELHIDRTKESKS